jgi:hypothetical protein
MAETLKDLVRETMDELLKSMPIEKRLEGLSLEERLKGLSVAERLKALSPEELIKALPPETVEALRRELKVNGSSPKPG